MGYPIRGLSDLLAVHKNIDDRQYPLKAFFLYTEDDEPLNSYIRDHFMELDRTSGRLLFFLINNPPEKWLNGARDRTYWHHFLDITKGQNLEFDSYNIQEVADHFGINYKQLPCIILFTSLEDNNFIIISGFDQLRPGQVGPVFNQLFQETDRFMNSANGKSLNTQSLRLFGFLKRIPNIRVESHFAQSHVGDILLQIQDLKKQVDAMEHNNVCRHEDVMTELGDIRQKLSAISIQIADARSELIDNLETLLLNDITMDERLEAHERLHQEFDERLFDRFRELEQRVSLQQDRMQQVHIPLPAHLINNLSIESKSFLMTSESIFNEVSDETGGEFDYSVCGIGLWKTLERELNLSFVDWLRITKGVCTSRPTIGRVSSRPNTEIKINTSYETGRSREFFVDINKIDKHGMLSGVMLGEIASILQSSHQHEINQLLSSKLVQYSSDIAGSRSPQGDWTGLPTDIRKVADKYRNSHAHTKQMKRDVFLDFRRFMLSDNGALLPRVLTYKYSIFK